MTEAEHRFPVGPLLAVVGALLVAVSLFLDWWDGVSAFDAYELLDLVLLGLAVTTIVSLAGGLGLIRPTISPSVSLLVSVITVVIVVSQLVNDPPAIAGQLDHAAGIWMALIGGLLMLVGALLSYAHISLAIDVKPRSGDDDAGPPRSPGAPAPPEPKPTQAAAPEADDDAPTLRVPGRPVGSDGEDTPPAASRP